MYFLVFSVSLNQYSTKVIGKNYLKMSISISTMRAQQWDQCNDIKLNISIFPFINFLVYYLHFPLPFYKTRAHTYQYKHMHKKLHLYGCIWRKLFSNISKWNAWQANTTHSCCVWKQEVSNPNITADGTLYRNVSLGVQLLMSYHD